MTAYSRTVLVTGAAGRLGRLVVAALARENGTRVIPVARERGELDGTPVVAVDLADHDAVRGLIEEHRPDVVLHLGAVAGHTAEADPLAAIAVNTGATRALAAALAQHPDRRLVLASTAAVYGDAEPAPRTEQSPPAGSSVYARTKANAEQAMAEHPVASVALRIANVYGPDFPDSLIARLLRSTPAEPVPMRAPDHFVRDYVHADDVVTALLAASRADLPDQHTVLNIGTGVGTSTRQLAALVEQHHPIHVTEVGGPPTYSVLASDRAREVLGFQPRSIQQGIVATS